MKLIRFFSPKAKQGFADPQIAKSFIPQWYKDAESFIIEPSGERAGGLKACVPYLDAMTAGYMLTTPVNIYINTKNNELGHVFNNSEGLSVKWDGPEAFDQFISERGKDSGSTMPRPPGHYPNHMIFRGYWTIKTPKGFSLLMTQPLNRSDLPFTIASGIIDSDKFFAPGNIPFFIKKDAPTVIPKGTPIAQLIPIKRESWKSVNNDVGLAEQDLFQSYMARVKETNYKRKFWQRKRYE